MNYFKFQSDYTAPSRQYITQRGKVFIPQKTWNKGDVVQAAKVGSRAVVVGMYEIPHFVLIRITKEEYDSAITRTTNATSGFEGNEIGSKNMMVLGLVAAVSTIIYFTNK